MSDPYDLARFLDAQRGTYSGALAEVRGGAKHGHWMWFVFPQIAGLGRSPTAQRYALSGAREAAAYLAHPVLGPRMREITAALLRLPRPNPTAMFGSVDALKLRSSMTLFARTDPAGPYRELLLRWFGGEEDAATIRQLAAEGDG